MIAKPCEISIIPLDDTGECWRASVKVAREWRKLPDVMGQGTEGGPWVGGEGSSPAAALEALTLKLGRMALAVAHWEAM